MTDQDIAIYFNWSCNQLAGDPVATDAYLRQHLYTIKGVAADLLKYIYYKPQTIYRGILMKEEGLTELEPHKGFTYLSFSEDKAIAADVFANKNHMMAFGVRMRYGNKLFGYVTEYTPRLDEILFHHKFLDILPYVEMQREVANIDASKIHEQKEVTILQPKHSLKLTSYELERLGS